MPELGNFRATVNSWHRLHVCCSSHRPICK